MPRPTREELTAKARASREPVEVPVHDWDCTVLVQGLTLQEINECNRKATNQVRGGEINADLRNGWYLVKGLVEPSITLDDAEVWLTESAAGPVADILAEILTRSGLTERARDAAKSGAEGQSDPALPDQAG